MNDHYTGSDPWGSFLGAIETSSPPIRALGITGYGGIERYEEVVNAQREAADQFYGECSGSVRDPFGHLWSIGHSIEEMSAEEMQRRRDPTMSLPT